jgi:hypothetical protein
MQHVSLADLLATLGLVIAAVGLWMLDPWALLVEAGLVLTAIGVMRAR